MSAQLARDVISALTASGVLEVVICPGARNGALISAFRESELQRHFHFEERSAAFFALGRSRRSDRPVAVVTTSGTACGELLPAAMEAAYSGVDLVLVTADRPKRFRGSGAPQACEQADLFGVYAEFAGDFEDGEAVSLPPLRGFPIHINVCFEDPNGSTTASVVQETKAVGCEDVAQWWQSRKNPLVLVGGLRLEEQRPVREFLNRQTGAVLAEGLSGLREADGVVKVADKLLQRENASGRPFDGVLRIGAVPVQRIWRDLEDTFADVPVVSVSALPYSGLGRGSWQWYTELDALAKLQGVEHIWAGGEEDNALFQDLNSLLEKWSESEAALVRALSEWIPENGFVFLGNSLPVREWDLAASFTPHHRILAASRGLNGIDGQISTFLGMAHFDRPNYAILGDLTSLYDMAGPWAMRFGLEQTDVTIAVINNGGGKIFEGMFHHPEFENSHETSFRHLAELWGWTYDLCASVAQLKGLDASAGHRPRIIEVRPNPEASQAFRKAWQELLV